ncbi:methionyl-tRNA formyltransferase [Salinicoccus albus]|uniref:methionyl-tRNA formyltransferase n=1 Tax=Salinicoccus albus TaxID=418756 RepID=UPI000364F7E4|nr:methionyl-tRNA formyltransferase [Salinicoccus albus]
MNETIIFMGTPDFSVPVLEALHEKYDIALVISQPDKPAGRKRVLTPPPVAAAAEALDVPLFQPDKIKDMDALEKIRALAPDLIITAAYGQILPKELLDIPRLCAINVHASLLPRHRGGAPIHRAILEGDEESGISIMYMEAGLDTGDIISQQSVAIADSDDAGSLHDKLSDIGADLLMETLPSIFDGTNSRIEQERSSATFSPNISKEDEKLDFTDEASVVFNHIRGLSPQPGAYTALDGKRLKIYGANAPHGISQRPPGTIERVTDSGFTVVCGDGRLIEITEVQLAGKSRTDAQKFTAGRQDLAGTVLGQVD